MLVTGASCSIINYRTLLEVSHFYHPIMVKRSKNLTKTNSGQVVPMIGYATVNFSYDPNGDYSFPLTVWITRMKTQNLLRIYFCQNQVSGIHCDLPGIKLKQPPKDFCYGSLHKNKIFHYVSRILTVKIPSTMHVDAKRAKYWKYSHRDPKSHFFPGLTFQSNRQAVSTDLVFVFIICTQSDKSTNI